MKIFPQEMWKHQLFNILYVENELVDWSKDDTKPSIIERINMYGPEDKPEWVKERDFMEQIAY